MNGRQKATKNQTNGADLMDLRKFMGEANSACIGITETGENVIKQIFFNCRISRSFRISIFFSSFQHCRCEKWFDDNGKINILGQRGSKKAFIWLWNTRYVRLTSTNIGLRWSKWQCSLSTHKSAVSSKWKINGQRQHGNRKPCKAKIKWRIQD